MILFEASTNHMPVVSLAGKVYIPITNEHFARTPGEYILYYIKSGEMNLVEGEIEYSLTAGDMILLDPTRRHFGRKTECEVEYYYVHFIWEGLREYPQKKNSVTSEETILHDLRMRNRMEDKKFDTLYIPKYHNVSERKRVEVEQKLIQIMGMTENGKEFHRMLTSCEFLLLLEITLKEELQFEKSQKDWAEIVRRKNKESRCNLSNLLTYLQCNYKSNLSSEDIEKSFHMNFDYLNRMFKKETGTTMIAYHNRYRIKEAKKLLESGAYSVKEVASILGFSNEFYFSRAYKKQEGISPAKCIRRERMSN